MKLVLLITCLIASSWTSSLHRNSRVIGGSNSLAGQFPFAAAIEITTSSGRYFCGGTLISNQWVITAGHCVLDAIHFSIQLGSNTLTSTDENRVTVTTSEYFVHPEFNIESLENDIALIELRLPIEFSNYLLAIHSLADAELESGTRLSIIGWGQMSDEDAGLSENLRYVVVTALTNEECRLTYGNQIVDTMVCAVGNLNEGSCHGDTGGPLVRVISMGNAQLVGVGSFVSGNGCESTDPSGYTRVYPYRDWISNVTNISFK